jgi:tRNA threonylcarbamoyladenosine biosynthesis protein TsaB
MLILGIETSQLRGSIAVCEGGDCLLESLLGEGAGRPTQTLVGEIEAAVNRLGLRVRDFEGVAVSIGPGSFTGLRIGVVCAKLLAYATDCSLAAVDTFEAIAANSPPEVCRVEVIDDAQRGDLFAASYRRQSDGAWRRDKAITIVNGQIWGRELRDVEAISGPGLAKPTTQPPAGICILPRDAWLPRACEVARIGLRQIEQGQTADCRTLEPFYLRRSAAEERLP